MRIRILEIVENEVEITKIENIKDIFVNPINNREIIISYRLNNKEYKERGERERIEIDTFKQTLRIEED